MVANAKATSCQSTTIQNVLAKIKEEEWRNKIEPIRQAYAEQVSAQHSPNPDPKRCSESMARTKKLKCQLPGVLFSGKFSKRNAQSLENYSGRIIADFDHLPTESILRVRNTLQASPHIEGLFLSPTGSGIKALVRVPNKPQDHAQAFEAVSKYCNGLTGFSIDPSGSDLARLCFVSSDPDAYYNPNATELEIGLHRLPDTQDTQGHSRLPTTFRKLIDDAFDSETNAKIDDSWYKSWLHKYIPKGPSETNRLQFKMCGELIDLEKVTGRKRTPKELRQLNKAWYQSTPAGFLRGSEEAYLDELGDRLSYRKIGASDNPVRTAWSQINEKPIPLEICSLDLPEHLNMTATLCAVLGKAMPSWFLSSRELAELLQITPPAAHKKLRQLEGFGIIRCIKRGDARLGGLATEYTTVAKSVS